MYELIEIATTDVTRFLKLKNIESEIIEECFDDSAVVSDKNFNFMKINQRYQCKIKLFGKAVREKTENSAICKVINREIIIGKKPMVEVQINNNYYYIAKKTIKDFLNDKSFYFCCTRKDLIQVDDVIHADLF
ncbi:MAG: hypothetical protein II997_07550 [Clostridia bacterium]|nr:hypothetical protein [Clostridia bacterium]